jgi:hypothetical protein
VPKDEVWAAAAVVVPAAAVVVPAAVVVVPAAAGPAGAAAVAAVSGWDPGVFASARLAATRSRTGKECPALRKSAPNVGA